MKEMNETAAKALDEIMGADTLETMRAFNGNLVIRIGGKRGFITIEGLERAIKEAEEEKQIDYRPRIIDFIDFIATHGEEDPNGDTGSSFAFVARNMTKEEAYDN